MGCETVNLREVLDGSVVVYNMGWTKHLRTRGTLLKTLSLFAKGNWKKNLYKSPQNLSNQ